MSWIIYFFILFIFGWIIWHSQFFSFGDLKKQFILGLFALKIAGGFALWFIYTYHYPDRSSSDIFTYFDDGMIIHSAIRYSFADYLKLITGIGGSDPGLVKYYDTCQFWIKEFNYGLLNDNRLIIRLHAIIRLFSMGNFHTHNLIFGFLSFSGIWALFKVFAEKLKGLEKIFLPILFAIPSLWFWSSGALKEAVLMFAFGFLLYYFNQLIENGISLRNSFAFLFFIVVLFLLKFYVLLAIIPAILFLFIRKFWVVRFQPVVFLGTHVACLMAVLLFGKITPYNLIEIICQKQHDFICFVQSLNNVGSKIDIPALDQGLWSMVKYAPQAFFRTMFRPFIIEGGSLTMLMAAVENALILIFLIIGLFFIDLKKMKDPWFWFCLSFILILFVLVGLTTPVLGALVRYKMPALPFIFIAMFLITDVEKVSRFVQRFYKLRSNTTRS